MSKKQPQHQACFLTQQLRFLVLETDLSSSPVYRTLFDLLIPILLFELTKILILPPKASSSYEDQTWHN